MSTMQTTAPTTWEDLVTHLARFSGALREAGIAVTLGDEIDAADSLAHIDIGDRAEVRLALRTSLKVEPRAWPLFDHLFDDFWRTDGGRRHGRGGRGRPRRRQQAPAPGRARTTRSPNSPKRSPSVAA